MKSGLSVVTAAIAVAVLAWLFAVPAAAADQAAAGNQVMSVAEQGRCKLAIRIAARSQMWNGDISRKEFRQVCDLLDDNKQAAKLTAFVGQKMATEARAAGRQPQLDGGGILAYILDHWPEIMAMVKELIGLFSAVPIDHGQHVVWPTMPATLSI